MEHRGRTSPSSRRGELLAAARSEAGKRRPSDLLAQWAVDPTVRPSPVDLRTSVAYDSLALEAATEYEALLLSPVAPLGAVSVLATGSQDRILSTIRGTEVVSDATNVLALECAARLRRDAAEHVRLCTVHQLLRMQPMGQDNGRTKHFRLLMLADAGVGLPEDGFEVAAVVAHLRVYRRLLESAAETHGLAWQRPVVVVRSNDVLPAIGPRVRTALEGTLPDVAIREESLESRYYHGLRVGYGVHDRVGSFQEIVDIGVFDWAAQLTSNRRHRYVASAIGLQLLPMLLT
ncbi:hypothetical protein Q9R08_00160 [Microbacterium sp. QXD-8]|uniref:Fido domain-containing protein n=1 Tax=Microbacterium psychrotolerans TaxID=3068321 RepID=A0ABU0YYN1_9MICO|nr:hypothetical protein [Microbacterium sp. QXD-8]MDQ7876376.1 hypothetical protein [Microbacterium sp. QXD-8]